MNRQQASLKPPCNYIFGVYRGLYENAQVSRRRWSLNTSICPACFHFCALSLSHTHSLALSVSPRLSPLSNFLLVSLRDKCLQNNMALRGGAVFSVRPVTLAGCWLANKQRKPKPVRGHTDLQRTQHNLGGGLSRVWPTFFFLSLSHSPRWRKMICFKTRAKYYHIYIFLFQKGSTGGVCSPFFLTAHPSL